MTSICVFCGAKTGVDPKWMALAEEIGTILANRSVRLVYGGGGVGLMGAVASAALRAGGEVVGVIPHSLMGQESGKFEVTRLERVDSMAERKTRMMELSDGFLVLPGGLGTLDELFEVLTLRQIGLHSKPSALLNYDGYFDPLTTMLSSQVAAGFVHAKDTEYLIKGDSPQDVVDRLLALCLLPAV